MSLEQVNQQQLAIAASLSSAQGLDKIIETELERQTDTDNGAKMEESTIKKALEGNTGKLGIEILAGLAAKLAKTLNTSQILGNLEEQYGFIESSQEEKTDDSVMIKSPNQYVAKTQKQKQNLNSGSGSSGGEEDAPQSKAADIKEYIGAYSQMLVNGGAEIKKKLERAESRLLEEQGLPLKELQAVKVQVANTVRHEILKQIKSSFLKGVLSKEKSLEGLVAKKELNNFIDYAFLNKKIGGYDFGGLDGNLQGAVDRMRGETREELRDFVKDALTDEVMKKSMGQESKELEKSIEDLLKLGKKVGFDLNEFLGKIPALKDDLGVNPIINFEYVSAEAGMDNSGQQQGHRYQYTPEEEKEILTDKLRAIYLRRAMSGDFRSVLETQFKMVKLKNGLIRLGAQNFDQIETEGKALAKVKLFEMLREGFEERATYAKLSGEAWGLTEKKIKTVVRNLGKVGVSLSQTELDAVRDRANKKMYEEAKHEVSLIETALEAQGEMAYLTSKKKMAVDILERLAGESNFQAPGEELKLSVKEAC